MTKELQRTRTVKRTEDTAAMTTGGRVSKWCGETKVRHTWVRSNPYHPSASEMVPVPALWT